MTGEIFKIAVREQLDKMIKDSTELFYVDVEKNELYEHYLASFPEGTNPIFRERTVHDCNACKGFIRKVGHVVAIIEDKMYTIWDVRVGGFEQTVADALAEKVRFKSLNGVFRHRDKTLGVKQQREVLDNGIVNIYDHFHYELPRAFISNDIASERGKFEADKQVLERSVEEISLSAGETVLELIGENQLYRGQEFTTHVQKFVEVKTEYDGLDKWEKPNWLWLKSVELKGLGRFKNTVIGTLLMDLSSGKPLEEAVRMFESKVAPTNYKRTTALVTQAMIDRAEAMVTELGIEKSLARRFAIAKDITINNVLFANQPMRKKMKKAAKKQSVFVQIEPTKKSYDDVDTMSIDEFINSVLPHTKKVEVMVENKHTNNLMSLIAPTNKRSPNIMKWNNPFSWSYNGEVTDTIKERVKRAGGNVDGFMRFSLSWDYYDDLDLHVVEPSGAVNGNHIYYGQKHSSSGGFLDVDMNVEDNGYLDPVENIAWQDKDRIREGRYTVFVKNFTKRNMSASGFEVQMEIDGQISLMSYDKPLRSKERVQVIEFDYKHDTGLKAVKSLPSSTVTKEVWGIETQQWSKVSTIMLSPNHWNGEQVGNKHWFFILDKCLNPDKARGFYNEFLMESLRDHRKVLELLSAKMKTEQTDKQLSGVGFSSTQENYVLAKVSGKFDRVVKVTFAPPRISRQQLHTERAVIADILGRCEICKRDVMSNDSRLPCPSCDYIYHTSHFLESVRVKPYCPTCSVRITQDQITQLVQLATV